MKTLPTIFLLITSVSLNKTGAPSIPLLHKKRVTLQCLNDFMLLKMNLQDIPKIKPASLHLRHFSCRPYHVTNTTAIFRVPLQGCGTTRGTKDRYITFSNAVENSLSPNKSRASFSQSAQVSHALELHFPFTCYYRQKYVITIQEGERHGARNHSGEKQRLEGHPSQSSSVPNEPSSNGEVMLHYSLSAVPTVVLLLNAVCS